MSISNSVGSRFDCHNLNRVTQKGCYHIIERTGEGSYVLLAVVIDGDMVNTIVTQMTPERQVLAVRRVGNTHYDERNEKVTYLNGTFDGRFGSSPHV